MDLRRRPIHSPCDCCRAPGCALCRAGLAVSRRALGGAERSRPSTVNGLGPDHHEDVAVGAVVLRHALSLAGKPELLLRLAVCDATDADEFCATARRPARHRSWIMVHPAAR